MFPLRLERASVFSAFPNETRAGGGGAFTGRCHLFFPSCFFFGLFTSWTMSSAFVDWYCFFLPHVYVVSCIDIVISLLLDFSRRALSSDLCSLSGLRPSTFACLLSLTLTRAFWSFVGMQQPLLSSFLLTRDPTWQISIPQWPNDGNGI